MHYIGIDIGKRRHVAVILETNGRQEVYELPFANDRDGFDE